MSNFITTGEEDEERLGDLLDQELHLIQEMHQQSEIVSSASGSSESDAKPRQPQNIPVNLPTFIDIKIIQDAYDHAMNKFDPEHHQPRLRFQMGGNCVWRPVTKSPKAASEHTVYFKADTTTPDRQDLIDDLRIGLKLESKPCWGLQGYLLKIGKRLGGSVLTEQIVDTLLTECGPNRTNGECLKRILMNFDMYNQIASRYKLPE